MYVIFLQEILHPHQDSVHDRGTPGSLGDVHVPYIKTTALKIWS